LVVASTACLRTIRHCEIHCKDISDEGGAKSPKGQCELAIRTVDDIIWENRRRAIFAKWLKDGRLQLGVDVDDFDVHIVRVPLEVGHAIEDGRIRTYAEFDAFPGVDNEARAGISQALFSPGSRDTEFFDSVRQCLARRSGQP
jgi:hypothetical protein